MILISDSGATKADWICLDNNHQQIFSTVTLGLNPEVLTRQDILDRLEENADLSKVKDQITKIHFYGAGCGTDRMIVFLMEIFQSFFPKADISIKEDTYAAIYATVENNDPAVVCIIGTGSNCSFWDGTQLHQKVQSLGYTLMDDCSGNYFGKQLIRAYYFNQMPSDIAAQFVAQFDLDTDVIKINLYKKPNPNRYLATFAKFMIENKSQLFFQKMIKEGLDMFINNYIMQYDQAKDFPTHFVGSVAYYLREELEELMNEKGLKVGNVYKKPIEGLTQYHQG